MATVRPRRQEKRIRPSIIATVTPTTPQLQGVDLIRLDAAHGSLADFSRVRASYSCPALLDLPGPSNHRRTSLLTTSEFLIYASAESFEWVSLNGVRGTTEIFHARELLLPSIQLACSLPCPDELGDAEFESIIAASDALVLPYGDYLREMGEDRANRQIERALVACARQYRPLLLSGGILSTMMNSRMPKISQLEWISEFAHAGCSGFVLTEETAASPHAQLCIETLGFVLAPLAVNSCQHQPGYARVATAPRLFGRQTAAMQEKE